MISLNAPLFKDKVIAAGSSADGPVIDVSGNFKGYFAVGLELTGLGSAKVELLGSVDGTTFILNPNKMSAIYDNFSITSGPGLDGKDIQMINGMGRLSSIKLRVTDLDATNDITVKLYIIGD